MKNWTLQGIKQQACTKNEIPIRELVKPCRHFLQELEANKALYEKGDKSKVLYERKTFAELSKSKKRSIQIMTMESRINHQHH